MNKLMAVMVAGLVLAGCGKAVEVVDQKEGQNQESQGTNIFTSIKDAVTKQLVLKCVYSDEEGTESITYIKGNVVRMVGTGEDTSTNGLMKDNMFYIWDGETKEGVKMEMAKLTENGATSMGDKQVNSIEDVVAVLEENKDKCAVSPESAGLLELPNDITFSDFSSLMEGASN